MRVSAVLFWIGVAFRFLTRSGRTSAALSLMVITAVAALIFLASLSVGVEDAMLRNTVGLFSGHITGDGLPASIGPGDLMRPGVASVLQRRFSNGILTHGARSQPLVLCAVDPGRETAVTALKRKIIMGAYPQRHHKAVLVGESIATALNVSVGDDLRLSSASAQTPMAVTVAGIYRTGMAAMDDNIGFVPRDLLPGDGHWTAAIFLRTGIDTGSLLADYREQGPDAAKFSSWETRMPDLRQLIDLEAISMTMVIVLVFAVVAVGIACAFVIVIIRNLREYGILKTMGVTRLEIAGLIVAKVILMNAVACTAGVLIGTFTTWGVAQAGGIDIGAWTSHNRYFAVSGIIVPRLTLFSLWTPPAAALMFSLLAAVWPAVLVARKRAADILRLV